MTANVDDFLPNPNWLYYPFGKGLMYFEPVYYRVQVHAALFEGDIQEGGRDRLNEILNDLRDRGFIRMYSIILKSHIRARTICRVIGMNRTAEHDSTITYELDLRAE
ncbi:MAG: hypothetical protein ACRBEE_05855 [Arenicella sp.]